MDNCPICQKPADSTFLGDHDHRWWCAQCGKFIISGTAAQLLENQRATLDLGKLSQVVRRQPRDTEDWMCITSYNLNELIAAAGIGAKPWRPSRGVHNYPRYSMLVVVG